jgi:hypothetical protein
MVLEKRPTERPLGGAAATRPERGQDDWARPDGPGPEAIRCLSILIVRHLWDEAVAPALSAARGGGRPAARGGGKAAEAEERLDWVAAAICATEALMQKNLPLTLKALARHYTPGAAGCGSRSPDVGGAVPD